MLLLLLFSCRYALLSPAVAAVAPVAACVPVDTPVIFDSILYIVLLLLLLYIAAVIISDCVEANRRVRNGV